MILNLAVAFYSWRLLPWCMDGSPPKSQLGKSEETPPLRRRIQTQIHRRKKAKPTYPMTDEWEQSQDSPPKGLKQLPEDMPKS